MDFFIIMEENELEDKLVKQQVPFTQISNDLINDKDISLKAKGVYCFMFSKPTNWKFTVKSMAKQLVEGERAIMSAISELKKHYWVSYEKQPNGTGIYKIYARKNDPNLQNPNLGFSSMLKQQCISNTDSNSNKEVNLKINWEILLKQFNEITGKNHRVINNAVRKKFMARLKDGYTKEDIFNTIKNAYESKHHKDTGHQYLTLEFVSRSDTIDKYSQKPNTPKKQ